MRYTSPDSGTFTINGNWDVASGPAHGVDLTVQVNGRTIPSTSFNGHCDMALKGVAINSGDVVSVIVGTNKTVAGGHNTTFRSKTYRTE